MVSVRDTIQCPQCGQNAFSEFRTRDWSESVFCFCCGYRESTHPVIDRQKQQQDPEHRPSVKVRKDGQQVFRTVRRVGYGAYQLTERNGIASVGVLQRRVTPKVIAQFKRDLTQPDTPALHHTCPEAVPKGTQCGASVDPTHSYLTRWNAKRRCVSLRDPLWGQVVVGEMPHDRERVEV